VDEVDERAVMRPDGKVVMETWARNIDLTPCARRSAPSPARLSSRSGRIRIISPTRAAGCQTIDRTCCVEVLVDVLNALNDTAEEGLATDNLFSPNFGVGTVFMDPRRAMVGVRLNLGR
jgi:hypothetical protein